MPIIQLIQNLPVSELAELYTRSWAALVLQPHGPEKERKGLNYTLNFQ